MPWWLTLIVNILAFLGYVEKGRELIVAHQKTVAQKAQDNADDEAPKSINSLAAKLEDGQG